MPGGWLVSIARRIARRETFERMVSPAIADMQLEASRGRVHRWKHYFAIGVVLIYAVLQDFRTDIYIAFDAEARRVAWKRAAIWYAGFGVFFTGMGLLYEVPWNLAGAGVWRAALTSAALKAFLAGFSLGIVPLILYQFRRAASLRSAVAAALVVAALTTAISFAVRPLEVWANRNLYESVEVRMALPSETPLAEDPERGMEYWLSYKADEFDSRFTWWRAIQHGVSVIPYALIGVVLGRRHGWKIALTVAGLFVTWTFVVVLTISWTGVPPPSRLAQYWRQIAILMVVAVVWLIRDELTRRTRLLRHVE